MKTIAILFSFFYMFAAHAESLCDYYRRELPTFYKMLCSGKNSARPAGASSTFSAGFNVNSASLPTEPTSYGLETIASFVRGNSRIWSPQFGIVKGFKKFGTGVSTSSNKTFYGNDILLREYSTKADVDNFNPPEDQNSPYPDLNLGSAFTLKQFQNKSQMQLGVSVRHNQTTATWGGGPALLYSSSKFSVGAGFTRERISNYLSPITFTSFSASTRLWIFEFEYIQLRNYGGPQLSPIHMMSGSFAFRSLLLTAAVRKLDFKYVGAVTQPHYAIQWTVVKNVSVGALYNYYPGTVSGAAQFYL